MLVRSPGRIRRLEEADLPQQRTCDRELDRDRRLKELNGHSTSCGKDGVRHAGARNAPRASLVLIRPDPRRKRAATTPKMKPPTWAKHGTVSPKCAPN
jgi:hypothetical protein